MKPGRALDALVATDVMGWNQEHDEVGLPPVVYGSDNLQPFPHYSTDIAAAWEVFLKMPATCPTDDGANLVIFRPSNDLVMVGYMDRMGDMAQSVQAQSAPLAICLAALEAVKELK